MVGSTIWAPKGEQGDPGPIGPQGPVGPQGPQGAAGPDAAAFAAFVANLANQTDTTKGAALVGYRNTTVALALDALAGGGRAKVVNGIADIRVSSSTGAATYFTLYYSTAGDQGAATYDVDLTDTTSADNGGTVLVTAAGLRVKLRTYAGVNVRQFGAKGDGSTNDTAAIQAALNASTRIYFPAGNYKVTAPMTGQYGSQLRGEGMLKVRIQRSGNWTGDTLTFGTSNGTVAASEIIIDEMLFEQLHPGFDPATFPTTMTDMQTAGQAHIKIFGGYNCQISNVWFQYGQYGIVLYGCVKTKLLDIHSFGSWDNKNANISETLASVYLASKTDVASHAFNTETRIERPYMGTGFPSANRTITVGTDISYSAYENIGPKAALLVAACEGLEVLDGYMGGCGQDCIQFVPTAICTMINIDGMFFDECFTSNIRFFPGSVVVNTVTIGPGNRFNGQGHTRNAIRCENNSGTPTVIGMSIEGVFTNHLETAMFFDNAQAVTVNAKLVNSYNVKNSTTNSPAISAGSYVNNVCTNIHFAGGLWGGGTNNWSSTNGCKWGPYFGAAASGSASNIRAILGISGGSVVGGVAQTYPT